MRTYEVPVVNTDIPSVMPNDGEVRRHQNELVASFQAAAITLPQVHIVTEHVLHGGMYARTIRIPPNTMLTGALTSCDNVCIVSGDITVTTDDGPRRLTGFHVLPATAGARRAGITHAETCWTTIIKTNASTVADAENDLTNESDTLQTNRPQITWDSSTTARLDYAEFVRDLGWTEEQIEAVVQNPHDCITTAECFASIYTDKSPIHGTGVFAKQDIRAGAEIAPGRKRGMRCVAGRWTNHSGAPNAAFQATDNPETEIVMVAITDIAQDTEITVDYRMSRTVANQLEGQ